MNATMNKPGRNIGCEDSRGVRLRGCATRKGKIVHALSVVKATLVFLSLIAVALDSWGCSRKQTRPRGTLRLALDVSDPGKPRVVIPQGSEFNAKAGNADLVWSFAERTIDDTTYFSAVLHREPRASNIIALGRNEEVTILMGNDELLMVTRIDVELSVKPKDSARVPVDAVTGKGLDVRNVFPPGAYSFRIIEAGAKGEQ